MRLGTAGRDPWVWGQLALFLVVLVGAPWLGRHLQPGTSFVQRIAAGLLVTLGLGALLRGIADLGRNLTPATRPLDEGVLVTQGIYRHVRHPIYLGFCLVLGGWALAGAGWLAGLVVFLVAVLYFEGKARVEERWMRERFAGYAEYARTTPRLIPLGWR